MSARPPDSVEATPAWAAGNPRLERAWLRASTLEYPLEQLAPRLDLLQGRLELERGNPVQALLTYERALRLFGELRDQEGLCVVKLAMAELHMRALEFPQAEERVYEARDLALRYGLRLRAADAWMSLAILQMRQQRRDDASRALQAAQAIVQEIGYGRLGRAMEEFERRWFAADVPNSAAEPAQNAPPGNTDYPSP